MRSAARSTNATSRASRNDADPERAVLQSAAIEAARVDTDCCAETHDRGRAAEIPLEDVVGEGGVRRAPIQHHRHDADEDDDQRRHDVEPVLTQEFLHGGCGQGL
jgi:hypothetical protein